MNDRLIHLGTPGLNDALFAIVLSAAAASAALLAVGAAREPSPLPTAGAVPHVQLERVVVSAKRVAPAVARAEVGASNS
jgi:hypothetical protein